MRFDAIRCDSIRFDSIRLVVQHFYWNWNNLCTQLRPKRQPRCCNTKDRGARTLWHATKFVLRCHMRCIASRGSLRQKPQAKSIWGVYCCHSSNNKSTATATWIKKLAPLNIWAIFTWKIETVPCVRKIGKSIHINRINKYNPGMRSGPLYHTSSTYKKFIAQQPFADCSTP